MDNVAIQQSQAQNHRETSRIVEVDSLVKKYGDFTAVKGISFDVKQGEIFGFLGPNGAGKTTTISMLATLLAPTSGKATIAGYDIESQRAEVRRSIGIVFQEPSLDDSLTAYENMDFHAVLYKIPRAERRKRIMRMLEMVQLDDRANEIVERFSGGMKRRLEIARGLLHTPRLLFLDEPTTGLDPQTRRYTWDYILRLREEENITIFLTTHYMEEAEFADRIVIMDHGEIVALDTPEGLKSQVGGDIITIATETPEADAQRIQEQFNIETVADPTKGEVRFEVKDAASFIPQFVREYDGDIQRLNMHRPTLDDVFLKLTGRSIRDSELDNKDVNRARLRQMRRVRRR